MKKQGEDMAPWILALRYFTIRSRHTAATGHRSNDPILGVCNDRVVLPSRLEMALPAFLDVDAAVRG